MAETNKKAYIDEVASALGGGSPQNTVTPTTESADTTDYYKALKSESYKTLLDSEIQASVSRDQATKYVNNDLKAMGMGGQGMAESTKAGIFNIYQGALTGAQSDYKKSMTDIGLQEAEALKAEASDQFESMTTLMGNAADKSQLDTVLSKYDIKVDDKGNLSGAGFDSLDLNSQRQLATLYSMYASQLGSDATVMKNIEGKTPYSTYDDLKDITLEDGTKAGANTEHEIKYITNDADFVNRLTNGKVVCIQNGSNDKQKTYLQFYNGKWYQVDANTYWSSTNRELVKGK